MKKNLDPSRSQVYNYTVSPIKSDEAIKGLTIANYSCSQFRDAKATNEPNATHAKRTIPAITSN